MNTVKYILFVYFVLIFASPLSGKELKNPITAGIFNFEGYHSKDMKGNLEGYGIDLLELLAEYSHLNFNYNGYEKSWQNMQEMLQNGEIDMVSSARKTPEREKIFAFSLPVGRNHTMLSKQLYNSRLKAGDYKTYDGMRVGAVAGSSQNKNLEDFARDKGFTYTLVEYESPQKMSNALQTGEVDAILSSNLRKPNNETLLDIIKSDNFYIITRKEDQKLLDEINYAIEQMNLNEGDWQNDIYYRHYGPGNKTIPEFSWRENVYIDSKVNNGQKITAIARGDIPPYSFVEEGTLKGILPDYFSKLMEEAGLPFEFIVPESLEDYKQKVANQEADVVLDKFGPDYADEKQDGPDLTTKSYMSSGIAKVTRVDFNGPLKTVGIVQAAPLDIHPSLMEDVELIYYPTSRDAFNAVQRGEVDGAYILPYTAQLFLNRDPGSGLFFTILEDKGANFKISLQPETDHELITIIKKAIKRLPQGTLNLLASNYLSISAGETSLLQFLYANPEITISGVIFLMFGSSLMLIMWLRGRWNRRLLATTEKANQDLSSQLAIVEALSRDYANVLAINPETGKTSIVKIAEYNNPDAEEEKTEIKDYKQLLSKYINLKVHPKDRKFLTNALSLTNICKQLKLNDEFSGTFRILENGEIKYFQFNFVKPQSQNGEQDSLILVGLRNIDEVIKREQEQKKALAEALAQSRYASAAKTAFLNNMSHDIRTPMNAIIGFTTLGIANAENPSLVKRYLGKIMTSGNHLLSLINDVLDMSRIESGKVKIEERLVHLPEILHDLRTIAQADVRSKQLDFQIDTLNVDNENIYCDRLRLNQILLNILSNAIKYTQSGGKVSVRLSQISQPRDGKATYEFRVRDTGIGMSAEFLKHVFEPFERENTTTISGIQGTGLGLAITKKIVDMMNGEITVQSKAGKGSEFTVRFHFRVDKEKEEDKILPQFNGMRALVVDDDIDSCTSLGKMLSEMGLRPDWTTLGKEALVRTQFAKDQKEDYGVYLIDWKMADMNGIELTRQLRKTVPANIPIIILTAYDWTDIEEEGLEAGVTGFCSKPVFLSELKKLLSQPSLKPQEEKNELESCPSFAGKHILLAEDNEMNQEIAQMILENAGFTVDIVENGQLALDKLQEMPVNTYDLILMDIQMPVMNGYDATKAIRKLDDQSKASIPIIAMTANAFEEDKQEALNSGMNGHIPKPIDIKKLMETLQEILNCKMEM